MSETTARRIGQALRAIMQQERLSVAHIMRVGGFARNTVENLRDGLTVYPARKTLHGMAVALATDPYTGVLDTPKMNQYEKDLNAAAGYGDLAAEQAESALELMLYYYLQSLPKARGWLKKIQKHATLEEHEIDLLDLPE